MTDDDFEIFLVIHANNVFKVVQPVLDSILLTQVNIDENNFFAFKFPQHCRGSSISTLNFSAV